MVPSFSLKSDLPSFWGGWVVRRCWVTFQCRGILLIWIIVGQGLIALAVGAGGGFLDIFSLVYHFCFLSLWETARYRLKYCLKGTLRNKQTYRRAIKEVSKAVNLYRINNQACRLSQKIYVITNLFIKNTNLFEIIRKSFLPIIFLNLYTKSP